MKRHFWGGGVDGKNNFNLKKNHNQANALKPKIVLNTIFSNNQFPFSIICHLSFSIDEKFEKSYRSFYNL